LRDRAGLTDRSTCLGIAILNGRDCLFGTNSHAVTSKQRRNRNDARDASCGREICVEFQLRRICKNPQHLREILMHTAPIQVRPATLSDHAAIVEFNLQLAAETEDKALDRQRLSRGVAALLGDPAKGRYFVAEVDGTVVGQMMHTWEWSDWRNGMMWWLGSVYVVPEHRGGGVFRALFECVLALAQADPEVVGLRLYYEQRNSAARNVYARLGFEPAGYEVLERMCDS
jgi:GNAT superfamily N-acetyltransferase